MKLSNNTIGMKTNIPACMTIQGTQNITPNGMHLQDLRIYIIEDQLSSAADVK